MRPITGAGQPPPPTPRRVLPVFDLVPDPAEVGVLPPAEPVRPVSINYVAPPPAEYAEDGRLLKRTRFGLFVQRADGAWETYWTEAEMRAKLYPLRRQGGTIVAPGIVGRSRNVWSF